MFDHFHVIKLYNDKLSDLRWDLYREASGPLDKKVLKVTRWLLLKNREKLTSSPRDKASLDEALKLSIPLALANYMKEYLRLIWKQDNMAAAAEIMDNLIARASGSGVRC